jgi:hypothetical protein
MVDNRLGHTVMVRGELDFVEIATASTEEEQARLLDVVDEVAEILKAIALALSCAPCN